MFENLEKLFIPEASFVLRRGMGDDEKRDTGDRDRLRDEGGERSSINICIMSEEEEEEKEEKERKERTHQPTAAAHFFLERR